MGLFLGVGGSAETELLGHSVLCAASSFAYRGLPGSWALFSCPLHAGLCLRGVWGGCFSLFVEFVLQTPTSLFSSVPFSVILSVQCPQGPTQMKVSFRRVSDTHMCEHTHTFSLETFRQF